MLHKIVIIQDDATITCYNEKGSPVTVNATMITSKKPSVGLLIFAMETICSMRHGGFLSPGGSQKSSEMNSFYSS